MIKNLFVIYIGGTHPGALIELHDIRLVIAEKIEDTYPILRESWWGKPESLHLDAWGRLAWADGYRIEIVENASSADAPRLYFINLGGYDPQQFTELHRNIFIVAENEQKAKLRALSHIQDWTLPHRDYQYEVDNIVNVNHLLNTLTYQIKLTPSTQSIPFEFTCNYKPIGKKVTV